MSRIRQSAAWIVCGWLCCQLSVLTAAPLSLFASAPHTTDAISCTCVHGANGQCPMHHPANPKPDCQCRSTADPDAAAIVSLLGPIAILADARTFTTRLPITTSPAHQITTFISFTSAPDGPPPRA
jgi:hypothetical protein